jgi:hypothetical protein
MRERLYLPDTRHSRDVDLQCLAILYTTLLRICRAKRHHYGRSSSLLPSRRTNQSYNWLHFQPTTALMGNENALHGHAVLIVRIGDRLAAPTWGAI